MGTEHSYRYVKLPTIAASGVTTNDKFKTDFCSNCRIITTTTAIDIGRTGNIYPASGSEVLCIPVLVDWSTAGEYNRRGVICVSRGTWTADGSYMNYFTTTSVTNDNGATLNIGGSVSNWGSSNNLQLTLGGETLTIFFVIDKDGATGKDYIALGKAISNYYFF